MSSNSSVPMEPAPPSLVQQLRDVEDPDKAFRLCDEAADRIEELERAIWTMHGEANEHIKRIEDLEKRWDLQVEDAVRMAAERISQLEAALREISARVIRFTYQGPSLMELDGIARCALEGKP